MLFTVVHLGTQLSQAQAAAAKPGLSCFLLWYFLLCISQRVFGRFFCGVWLVWKACSQRTLDTKYLLCWHLYYKLLAPVKNNPIETFWPNYSKLPLLKHNRKLTFQFLLLPSEKLVCSHLLWDWAELHRQENRPLGSWNPAKQSWTCILDCKEGNNITRKMDLPYKWHYNILIRQQSNVGYPIQKFTLVAYYLLVSEEAYDSVIMLNTGFLQNNKPEILVIKTHQRNMKIQSEEVKLTKLNRSLFLESITPLPPAPFHPRVSRNCKDLAPGTQKGKFFPLWVQGCPRLHQV